MGVYGKTKFLGEKHITDSKVKGIVIRTSWLYSAFGKNFVKTILKLSDEKKEIKVVNDQFGSPTNAADLAEACLKILRKLEKHNYKIQKFIIFKPWICSWYEFAKSSISLSKRLLYNSCFISRIYNQSSNDPNFLF